MIDHDVTNIPQGTHLYVTNNHTIEINHQGHYYQLLQVPEEASIDRQLPEWMPALALVLTRLHLAMMAHLLDTTVLHLDLIDHPLDLTILRRNLTDLLLGLTARRLVSMDHRLLVLTDLLHRDSTVLLHLDSMGLPLLASMDLRHLDLTGHHLLGLTALLHLALMGRRLLALMDHRLLGLTALLHLDSTGLRRALMALLTRMHHGQCLPPAVKNRSSAADLDRGVDRPSVVVVYATILNRVAALAATIAGTVTTDCSMIHVDVSSFSHDGDVSNSRPPPSKAQSAPKTRMCNTYPAVQNCRFGDRCSFAHSERELASQDKFNHAMNNNNIPPPTTHYPVPPPTQQQQQSLSNHSEPPPPLATTATSSAPQQTPPVRQRRSRWEDKKPASQAPVETPEAPKEDDDAAEAAAPEFTLEYDDEN
ncbi:unnamed protein product [Aphanomyces euteiches]